MNISKTKQIFLWNKLCLSHRWHILRSYRFLAEVTFKTYVIRHTTKSHLPCFILKFFNQVYCYASISLLFCASVVLVIWWTKYSNYFEIALHTAYKCSLNRCICGFGKYDWSKYSSKLFTLIWMCVELIGLALCPCSLDLLKFIKFFTVTTGKCEGLCTIINWWKHTKSFCSHLKQFLTLPICCFKNLMNLLCCHIFPRCNPVFSLGKHAACH